MNLSSSAYGSHHVFAGKEAKRYGIDRSFRVQYRLKKRGEKT
jgi:hypothetical protein